MNQPSGTSPQLAYGIAPPDHRLPDATTLGPVRLQVSDLARSIAYYHDVIGLRPLSQDDGVAVMGAHGDAEPLLYLHELKGAKPVPKRGHLGLFHLAILLPDRPALGRFLRHLAERRIPAGTSDHLVSEAIYLSDPDGLGLEIYADRPRAQWETEGRQLAMGTLPLDVESVVNAGAGVPWTGAPTGTKVGHVHLHVSDLDRGARFYHDALGMDKIVWAYPGALFLSAGGYHHHLGTNTWAKDADSARRDEARLLEWTVDVPTPDDVTAVAASMTRHDVEVTVDGAAIVMRDPWGTQVRVRATMR